MFLSMMEDGRNAAIRQNCNDVFKECIIKTVEIFSRQVIYRAIAFSQTVNTEMEQARLYPVIARERSDYKDLCLLLQTVAGRWCL